MPNTDNLATGPAQGTSYMYKYGTTPNTRTVVSQKVRILAPAYGAQTKQLYQIGVLSNFAPTQSRTVEPVRSIGFGDIVAEMVPGNTEPMTCSTERTLLYLSNLWQATGYAGGVDGPARSLRHHRWPFDVLQQIVFSVIADTEIGVGAVDTVRTLDYGQTWKPGAGAGSHNILVTMYEACWWQDWNATFNKDTAMVAESGTFTTTDVHDFSSTYGEFMQTGNDPSGDDPQLGSIRFDQTFNGNRGLAAATLNQGIG
jgi:hypothetical protein